MTRIKEFWLLVCFIVLLVAVLVRYAKIQPFRSHFSAVCLPLEPSDGAALFWPLKQVHPAQGDRILPVNTSAEGLKSTWLVELCSGVVSPGVHSRSGSLRVTRVRGCQGTEASTSPALDASTPKYLKDAGAALGPDEFHAILEGPEWHFLWPQHQGGCVYSFPYSVNSPGKYRVLLINLRDSWEALEEVHWIYHTLTLDNLVGDHTFFEVGMRTHLEESGEMPCVTPLPIVPAGRWVRKPSAGPLLDLFDSWDAPPVTARVTFYFGGINAFYYTDARQDIAWLSEKCSRPDTLDGSLSCFENKKVLIVGDSQSRFASTFLVETLCKNKAPIPKYPEGEIVPVEPSCPGVSVSYMRDELGTMPLPVSGDWDVIFVNFGQHQVSRSYIPVAHYETLVKEYAEKVLLPYTELHPVTRIAWLETFPFNPSTHLFTIMHNDLRTYHRLKLHVLAARSVFQPYLDARQLGYVPIFDFLQPLADFADTSGHFNGIPEVAAEIAWRFSSFVCDSYGSV